MRALLLAQFLFGIAVVTPAQDAFPPAKNSRSPAELVPASSMFYLEFDGIDSHRSAYDKTVLAKLLKHELGDFFKDLGKRIQKAAEANEETAPATQPVEDDAAPSDAESYNAAPPEAKRTQNGMDARVVKSMMKLVDELWTQGFALSADWKNENDGQITCVLPNGAAKKNWQHIHQVLKTLAKDNFPYKTIEVRGRHVYQSQWTNHEATKVEVEQLDKLIADAKERTANQSPQPDNTTKENQAPERLKLEVKAIAPPADLVGRAQDYYFAWWKEGADVVCICGTKPVHVTLDVIDGKKPNLTSNPLYKKATRCDGYESCCRGFVDAEQLLDLFVNSSESTDKLARRLESIGRRIMVNQLGLDGLHSATWNWGFEGKYQRSTVRLHVDAPEQRRGLLKLISAPIEFSASDLPPLPDDADWVSVHHVDWERIYDTLLGTTQSVEMAQWLANGGPFGGKMPAAEADFKKALDMDLKRELLSALDSTVVLSSAHSEGAWILGNTLAARVKDPEKALAAMDKLFVKLFKAIGLSEEVSIHHATYGGATIHTVRLAKNQMCLFPSYAVHDGWLLLGAFPQNVKSYLWRLKHPNMSWKAPAIVQQAIKAGLKNGNPNSKLAAVTVIDARRSLDIVLPLTSAFGFGFAGSDSPWAPVFDVGSLPPTKAITSKLSPNVTAFFEDGDAWRWESYATLEIPSGTELAILYGGTMILGLATDFVSRTFSVNQTPCALPELPVPEAACRHGSREMVRCVAPLEKDAVPNNPTELPDAVEPMGAATLLSNAPVQTSSSIVPKAIATPSVSRLCVPCVQTSNSIVPKAIATPISRTHVRFAQPTGMRVTWIWDRYIVKEEDPLPEIEVPGGVELEQGKTYLLKLTNIPGKPGLEVYPTLQVVPADNPRTAEFLAHGSVPLAFSDDDFKQIRASNAFVKVVYLPRQDSDHTDYIAPCQLRSIGLGPHADAISEASRKGDVLLVIRFGNMEP
jgi:hypothetical protein